MSDIENEDNHTETVYSEKEDSEVENDDHENTSNNDKTY